MGTTTSACGLPGASRASKPSSPGATTRCSSGMPKPRVLPVPVFACPMMSCPVSATGRVIAWMGKGWVMPTPARACTIGAWTPRSAKVGRSSSALSSSSAVSVSLSMSLSVGYVCVCGHGLLPGRGGGRTPSCTGRASAGQHRWVWEPIGHPTGHPDPSAAPTGSIGGRPRDLYRVTARRRPTLPDRGGRVRRYPSAHDRARDERARPAACRRRSRLPGGRRRPARCPRVRRAHRLLQAGLGRRPRAVAVRQGGAGAVRGRRVRALRAAAAPPAGSRHGPRRRDGAVRRGPGRLPRPDGAADLAGGPGQGVRR